MVISSAGSPSRWLAAAIPRWKKPISSRATRVRLRNLETKETREIPLDGVFVANGHDPNTTVFKGKLEMDANGYLLAKHGSLTAIPGVFVAGDVQDHRYRQAVTAAGSG